jgi:hypothetical protein
MNLTRIDGLQEGSIASNSWVSVPIFFDCPFFQDYITEKADTRDTEADAVSFTGNTIGCFAGDGLSEINLSMAVRAGFLMGVVSPEICSFSLLAAAGAELKLATTH